MTRRWLVKLALTGAVMEIAVGVCGFALGGLMAGVAALVGASLATGAQVAAVALLRPAMDAAAPAFQRRWAAGVGLRFASFLVVAVLILTVRHVLPPAWLGAGYLATLLMLLFGEMTFLR